MRVFQIGVAGDVEAGSAHAVDAPGEDGVELRRLHVLNACPHGCRCDAGVAVDGAQGDVGEALEKAVGVE